MRPAISGRTSAASLPVIWPSRTPSSRSADRLMMVILPAASRPITPAPTPASTASEKRRRSSIWSRARMRSEFCARSSEVILLKLSPRLARSPSDWRTGTCTYRLPEATRSAAVIRRRIGATRRFAKLRPIQTEDSSRIIAITAYISANAICTPKRLCSSPRYSSRLASVCRRYWITRGSIGRATKRNVSSKLMIGIMAAT